MENKNSFITKYILSLSERSTNQDNGDFKIGFDWIIYQYGFFKQWQPIKQPFSREKKDEQLSHKSEQEYGIDFSFYDEFNEEYIVFVLKAEKLTYSNWTSKNFDSDLRMAIAPNLELLGIKKEKIKKYKIILVYNKSDDNGGINLFNNFVNASPKTIFDNKIEMSFERWNIDRLVLEVINNILKPDILPNNLSSLLSYVTYLFSNIDYGTTAWNDQLLPNFKKFLDTTFEKGIDERKVYLIPFALIIIKGDKNTPNSKVAWIELIEWAILKLWDITLNLDDKKIKNIVNDIWNNFYIQELNLYFEKNKDTLCAKNGVIVNKTPCLDLILLNTVNSIYWHIGRLSLLALSFIDLNNPEKYKHTINICNNYLISIINNNSSVFYPLIDLHHIQLFMIFYMLYLGNRLDVYYDFMIDLLNYLIPRRLLNSNIPFIDYSNDLSIVALYITNITKQIKNSSNESSYLITMLLELCLIFEKEKSVDIIDEFFKKLINENNEFNIKQINLVSWVPDKNWEENIFKKQTETGIGMDTGNFNDFYNKKTKYENIKIFIKESKERDIDVSKLKCPFPTYLLACIKNKSPLPPAFWRQFIMKNIKE